MKWVHAGSEIATRDWAEASASRAAESRLHQRFSSTTRESLAADLRAILAPHHLTQAREVATQMTKPAAGVTTAADLLEGRLHP